MAKIDLIMLKKCADLVINRRGSNGDETMKELNVEITGISPLLQHRFVEEKSEASKRKQKVYVDEDELEKALYKNQEGKIIQPAIHIKSAMVKSASNFKFEGKKTYKDIIKAEVIIDPLEIVHLNQAYEMDKRGVVIQRARVMRVRPKFNDWKLQFKILFNEDRLTPKILKEIIEDAGKTVGIGDNRPEYGRFKITKFE